jgi:hypothetical protein
VLATHLRKLHELQLFDELGTAVLAAATAPCGSGHRTSAARSWINLSRQVSNCSRISAMAGALLLQCSHQPAKEALFKILRDSTTFLKCILPPTITSKSRTEAPIVGKNGVQCCFLEREESGQQATCSGEERTHKWPLQAGFPDLDAGTSSGKPLCNARMRGDDGTIENANFAEGVEVAFSTRLPMLVAGKKWFGNWGQKRSVCSDGQGLHGRSNLLWPSLVSLQKVSFPLTILKETDCHCIFYS